MFVLLCDKIYMILAWIKTCINAISSWGLLVMEILTIQIGPLETDFPKRSTHQRGRCESNGLEWEEYTVSTAPGESYI